MASTKSNGFYLKEWFPLKGMAILLNGNQGIWLPLKGMASAKRNGFH